MVKKLPEPARTEQTKEDGSLFSDKELWAYKYGKSKSRKDGK